MLPRSSNLGFDNIRDLYALDEYFSPSYESCGKKAQDGFYLAEGYLFKEGKLCIPQGSIRKLLVKESHEGGLMGHFGIDKTLVVPPPSYPSPSPPCLVTNYSLSLGIGKGFGNILNSTEEEKKKNEGSTREDRNRENN